MPVPGPGYTITARVSAPPTASSAGDLAAAVGRVGGVVTAFDVVDAGVDHIVIDISCNALNEAHAKEITEALGAMDGVEVRKVSDRTFLVHQIGRAHV